MDAGQRAPADEAPPGLEPPAPVETLSLYRGERALLLGLLSGLGPADWDRPTPCPGWSVRDLALHLLGDDLGVLSRHRDGHRPNALRPGETLGVMLARINDEWIQATWRLSNRVIVDLLAWTGEQTFALWSDLNLDELGGSVSWAGPAPAPRWLDMAREYTERWVHQQQLREAVGQPLLTSDLWLAPVLATFARALPRTYATLDAPPGTAVTLTLDDVGGPDGSAWTVVRAPEASSPLAQERRSTAASTTEEFRWVLFAGRPEAPAAEVRMGGDTAWRLFTKGITSDEAAERAVLLGDQVLARRLLATVAIIA